MLKGAALVLPKGLLDSRFAPQPEAKPIGFAEDPDNRAEVEQRAMESVMAAERATGFVPPDAFHLALVLVENGFAHAPVYVQRFFQRELASPRRPSSST